jgi:hypothetical protein
LTVSGVISTDMVSSRLSTLCSLIPCRTFLHLSMTELLKDPEELMMAQRCVPFPCG